jgi:hypothetical protein
VTHESQYIALMTERERKNYKYLRFEGEN